MMSKDLIVCLGQEGSVRLIYCSYDQFIESNSHRDFDILFIRKEDKTWFDRFYENIFYSKPNQQEIIFLTDYLAGSLEIGYSLKDAIGFYLQQCKNRKFAKILCDILVDIDEGLSFSQAISKQDIFGSLYVQAIAGAEKYGALEGVLRNIKSYLEEKKAFKSRLKKALIYPLFVFFIVVCFLIFAANFLFPNLMPLFSQLSVLPFSTKIILLLFDFFKIHYVLIVVFCFGFGALSYFLMQIDSIREYLSFLMFRMPFFSDLYRSFYLYVFLKSFSLLLSQHISLPQVFKTLSTHQSNRALQRVLGDCFKSLQNGYDMRTALAQYSFVFSPMVFYSLCVAERNGVLVDMSNRLALFSQKNLKENMTLFFTVLNPILILILSFIVFFILSAVYLPILSILLSSL